MRKNIPSRGFSLVEVMVATAISGLAMIGVIRFTTAALNIYYYDTGRILLNKDIRSFTAEMTTNAVYSNYFRIYPSFASRSTTTGSGGSAVTTDNSVNDGLSGDMLVLVFADTDPATGVTLINRLIGYYRDPDDPSVSTSTGPVRKFDVAVPNVNPATTPLYSILNTYAPTSTAHTNRQVLELAQGLSNGTLFYNFQDRSAMVRGQIIEEGNLRIRRVVNTYNFTVSPRG